MDIGHMVVQGIELMFVGMGTVYIFLGLLVYSVGKMSEAVQAYERTLPPAPVAKNKPTGTVAAKSDHIAAISAAVHQHRSS